MSAKQIFIFCSNNSQDWTSTRVSLESQRFYNVHQIHMNTRTRVLDQYIYIYTSIFFLYSFLISLSNIICLSCALSSPSDYSDRSRLALLFAFSSVALFDNVFTPLSLIEIIHLHRSRQDFASIERESVNLSLSLSLSHIHTHIAFATFSFVPTCQISPCRSSSIGWVARRARLSQSLAQSDTVVMWRYARQSLQLVQVSRRRIVTMLVYIFLFPFQMLARSSISLLARIAPRFREFRGMRAQHSEY